MKRLPLSEQLQRDKGRKETKQVNKVLHIVREGDDDEDRKDRHHLYKHNAENCLNVMDETGYPVGVILDCDGKYGSIFAREAFKRQGKTDGAVDDWRAEQRAKKCHPVMVTAWTKDDARRAMVTTSPTGADTFDLQAKASERFIIVIGKKGNSYIPVVD